MSQIDRSELTVALVGNPNCGKSVLFNKLTGSRQKVANYAGVTVEGKQGQLTTQNGRHITIIDLPGTYSLEAMGADEAVTRDACLGKRPDIPTPDLIVCVVDATNLRLHLHLVLEVMALGKPIVLALNMMDEAKSRGMFIDVEKLQKRLGIKIIETVATQSLGIGNLITEFNMAKKSDVAVHADITDKHLYIRQTLKECVTTPQGANARDEAIDRVVLHPIFGFLILILVMFATFQAVYSGAAPLADAINETINWLGNGVASAVPDGLLKSFISDVIFGGIGAVLVFLPQILILFAFILALEESGYLPRAAYLLDTIMSKAGLTGRAFVPLLSSFACAVPGIMATRSIPNLRDRITTILIAPLMTCSARLPVYTLLIGAFIPDTKIWRFVSLQGFVLFVLYFGGIISAFLVAYVIKKWRKDTQESVLMMELPAYRMPETMSLLNGLFERAKIFMQRITGTILAVTSLLWFLVTFPKPPVGAVGPAINYSLAGIIGHFIQPIFAPIGFNWQICVALIPGMAAREVAVSALGTVYSVASDSDQGVQRLGDIVHQTWPLPTALSLLAWYVFAPQCVATLAVIKRETKSWRYVIIATAYLFALAYFASFATYQISMRMM